MIVWWIWSERCRPLTAGDGRCQMHSHLMETNEGSERPGGGGLINNDSCVFIITACLLIRLWHKAKSGKQYTGEKRIQSSYTPCSFINRPPGPPHSVHTVSPSGWWRERVKGLQCVNAWGTIYMCVYGAYNRLHFMAQCPRMLTIEK